MSINIISIGIPGVPDSEMKLTFGSNVSASRIVSFVKRNAQIREDYGLISNSEASEMINQTEDKLKRLNVA